MNLYRRTFSALKPHWKRLALASVSSSISSLFAALMIWMVGPLMSTLFQPGTASNPANSGQLMFPDMAGTPGQLVQRLRPWAAAGLAYAIVYFPDAAYDPSGLELFAREVVPAFA